MTWDQSFVPPPHRLSKDKQPLTPTSGAGDHLQSACSPAEECPTFSYCDTPFARVTVSWILSGGTTVAWELRSDFIPPSTPLYFQLQVGTSVNPHAHWEDVGLEMSDVYCAVDGQQRIFSSINYTHYRVRLRIGEQVWFSEPTGLLGVLSWNDWNMAREIIRKEKLMLRLSAQEGFLLKRRYSGIPCNYCIDARTREVTRHDCPLCLGTGWKCGYFYPQACVWAALSTRTRRVHLDGGQARGVVAEQTIIAERMVLTDFMSDEDVWVNANTDDRYFIHRVREVASWRGVPLVGQVELRPIPTSSPIYKIVIPQQLIMAMRQLSGCI